MTSINDIIKREVNPFDLINLKPGNFWGEEQDSNLTVESIHQQQIAQIEELVDLVAKDHHSRSVFLSGDSGSGKSYLLGRLKRTLNSKAFFAYIGPWVESDHIWRHILRCMVDSLMQIPDGQQESQLMLWLRSLSAFSKQIANQNIWQLLQSDRRKFIKHLKDTYKQSAIYSPDIFFGVLHDLATPELYDLACQWLRGDDLSEESMRELKVKHCIDTEDAAKTIVANFGRISTQTQPIVLCFDSLDNIPQLPGGYLDLQALFNVNTTIQNDNLKNFIVIISIITSTWRQNWYRIQQADKDRIDKEVKLNAITLDQAEALWSDRLRPLHQAANPQPTSPIYPLNRQTLEQKFPGRKTKPREALICGRKEYQKYKLTLEPSIVSPRSQPTANKQPTFIKTSSDFLQKQPTDEKRSTSINTLEEQPTNEKGLDPKIIEPNKTEAEFKIIWQQELKKNQEKITKISFFPGSDLIGMLQEVLKALQVQNIKPKLLSGTYASYSLSYQQSGKKQRVGVVWTEDSDMRKFYDVMNACQKALDKNTCQNLQLIRAATIGSSNLAGHKIHRKIFANSQHRHIQPNLSSIHYLATYHSLLNSALGHELVVAGKTINREELEDLIRTTKVLDECLLLQNLSLVSSKTNPKESNLHIVKDYLLNLIITQQFMGRPALVQNGHQQFSDVNKSEIETLIDELCKEKKIRIIDPKLKLEGQTVCLVV